MVPTNIFIHNAGGAPIYEQICTQIKDQILSGALRAGEPLPSIRSLAKDLRISVITTKRAYEDLEGQGFLTTVAGKGSFVAEGNRDALRQVRLEEVKGCLWQAVSKARACHLEKQELLNLFESLLEEDTNHE